MAEKEISVGNCFICGAELGKLKMKNHVIKEHTLKEGGERAVLIRAEGVDKNYWLLLDIAADAVLWDLDLFLRRIWVECCDHMSIFIDKRFDGNEFDKEQKISDFSPGDKLCYLYDMGSTTELTISIIGKARRPKQNDEVRLLARNAAPVYTCACGKPATTLCVECWWHTGNPFFCADCAKAHDHNDTMLPSANSPRMGVCGYYGERDKWIFKPGIFGGK
ncbi:MAG: hypothetical protein LBT01_07250 [Spirochaetaceae bacterium]|nr:hypothetical protein [Spirochaetaceae bacterium]